MKRSLNAGLGCLIFLVLFPFTGVRSQNLTGIWRGYFITETGEYYKLEFQVLQEKNNAVTGVSYSYLDVRFYGKATMTGSLTAGGPTLRIREIRTVEVKSSLGGGTCIMNYTLSHDRSGKEEYLEGTYLGKYETKGASASEGRWGDCGGGKVFLRKVNTSDFYVEPFLKNRPKEKKVIVNEPPPVVKKDTVKKAPGPKPPVVKKNEPLPPVTKPNPAPLRTDTTTRQPQPIPVVKTPPKVRTPAPDVLQVRQNEVVKVFTLSDKDVTVKLYDNGEIDGDTISVYLDNNLVLASKRLTAQPLVVKLRLDEDNNEHELTMVAENLGSIPPNTSLMVVEAGEQRFDVRITSTEQKNAVVRFLYRKPQ
ncbi:MAG: hypothetical protein RJA57_704 [Bacteroidota bacterium]